jgi:hypothetical protein
MNNFLRSKQEYSAYTQEYTVNNANQLLSLAISIKSLCKYHTYFFIHINSCIDDDIRKYLKLCNINVDKVNIIKTDFESKKFPIWINNIKEDTFNVEEDYKNILKFLNSYKLEYDGIFENKLLELRYKKNKTPCERIIHGVFEELYIEHHHIGVLMKSC